MNDQALTAQQLEALILQAHTRYIVAVLILTGMLAVSLGTISHAMGWRKTGFIFLGLYGGLMSFLGVGLSYIFGPVALIGALIGFIRQWVLDGTGAGKNRAGYILPPSR